MWRHVFRSHMTHNDLDRFVIALNHPDRLQRPVVSLAAASAERFQQALIWNIFRTLELLTPSFWLRRFHIRLTGSLRRRHHRSQGERFQAENRVSV